MKRVNPKDAGLGENLAALGIAGVMTAKCKPGMGLTIKIYKRKTGGMLRVSKNTENEKKDIPILKKGGFLPLLFPILGALGVLGGRAAGIIKTVNDANANRE